MTSPDRLRQHPEDRLASPIQAVKLAEAAARLRAEPHDAVAGHRQITVARHGPVTLMLFVFQPEGFIKEHQAEGEVIIQILTGKLQISVDEETHELGPGELVALAPSIPHSVRALVATEMLLTVCRQPAEPETA